MIMTVRPWTLRERNVFPIIFTSQPCFPPAHSWAAQKWVRSSQMIWDKCASRWLVVGKDYCVPPHAEIFSVPAATTLNTGIAEGWVDEEFWLRSEWNFTLVNKVFRGISPAKVWGLSWMVEEVGVREHVFGSSFPADFQRVLRDITCCGEFFKLKIEFCNWLRLFMFHKYFALMFYLWKFLCSRIHKSFSWYKF